MPDTSHICVVTRNVLENDFRFDWFVHAEVSIGHQRTSWVFLHRSDNEDIFSDLEMLSYIPLSSVLLQNPAVRPYLDEPVGSTFSVDAETGRILNWTEQRTITFDRRVSTPTAAGVPLNVMRWLSLFPADALTSIVSAALLSLAYLHHPAWLLPTIYFSLFAFARYTRVKEHFKFGEARPSIIVSVKPLLTATEMQIVWKDQPKRIVTVSRVNPRAFRLETVSIGSEFCSAVLVTTPKWYDFPKKFSLDPLPVVYATTDPAELEKAGDAILPRYRVTLNESLIHLPTRLKKGSYEIPAFQPESDAAATDCK